MKKAMTLMELIIVIVIIGILGIYLAPKTSSDANERARDQIINHIRYTQHLALIDDKFDPKSEKWMKGFWQVYFHKVDNGTDDQGYTIFSDKPDYSGNPNSLKEVALDPANSDFLLSPKHSGFLTTKKFSKNLNLSETYGINEIIFSKSCQYYGSKRISFDNLGRPYKGSPKSYKEENYQKRLLEKTCKILLVNKNSSAEPACICVEPFTGFAHRGEYKNGLIPENACNCEADLL